MGKRWRVLLFAGLADLAGSRELDVELDLAEPRVRDLQAAAESRCPGLRGRRYRVAVDACYAAGEERVPAGAEVAFIPPVSGG